MPVKLRLFKRRLDPDAECDAWECAFKSEYDFWEDLPPIGVSTNAYGVPPVGVAHEAWGRLRGIFIERYGIDGPGGRWALHTFG